MRSIWTLAILGLVAFAPPASAQGFGVGGRMAWVTSDDDSDVDSVRFVGGQIRFTGSRFGLELAMDRHTESCDELY